MNFQRARRTPVGAVLGLALAALVTGCGGEEPAPPVSDDELERLHGLGYLEYSEGAAGPGAGVVQLDPQRSQPGYTLYAYRGLPRVVLLDARGAVVHRWEVDTPVSATHLLPNGDLLAIARGLARFDRSGRLLWRKPLDLHHEVAPGPAGRFLTIGRRFRPAPELLEGRRDIAPGREVPIHEDGILLFDDDGRVLEERWIYDALRARPDLLRLKPAKLKEEGPHAWLDLLHTNSAQWLDDPALAARDPLYGPRHVLVTLRNQDAVAILRWEPFELVWAWGPGELRRPHHATLLPNGNVLVFDNRRGAGWSRVVEVDPLRRAVVWEYGSPDRRDFYSKTEGSAQRLANGNTLIGQSDEGRAFEVTPDGAMVWEFLVPEKNEAGQRATFVRMRRYDEAAVRAVVER